MATLWAIGNLCDFFKDYIKYSLCQLLGLLASPSTVCPGQMPHSLHPSPSSIILRESPMTTLVQMQWFGLKRGGGRKSFPSGTQLACCVHPSLFPFPPHHPHSHCGPQTPRLRNFREHLSLDSIQSGEMELFHVEFEYLIGKKKKKADYQSSLIPAWLLQYRRDEI